MTVVHDFMEIYEQGERIKMPVCDFNYVVALVRKKDVERCIHTPVFQLEAKMNRLKSEQLERQVDRILASGKSVTDPGVDAPTNQAEKEGKLL